MTKLLSKRLTAASTSLHPATVMRKVAAGEFPQPVRLGPARIAFVEAEVAKWIEDRIAERNRALAVNHKDV